MSHECIKAMVTIVNRGDGTALAKLYEQNGVPLHVQASAEGTASPEMISMLGLTHREKDILFSLAPGSTIEELLSNLADDYSGILSVRGLAFSIRLSALTASVDTALNEISSQAKGGSIMVYEKEYALVMVSINQGYTDEVMKTACRAGATGGTVIRGRWVGAEHLEQFHGITLQDEREILIIVCSRPHRNAIMDAINAEHGLSSEQQAVVCSIPIDRLVRLA